MAGVLDAPGGGYLSHESAAAWWQIPGFWLRQPIHVVIPWQGTNRRTRLAMVHYHRDLPHDHLTTVHGIPVVSPLLTVFLIASCGDLGRTARALDHGLAMRLFSVAALQRTVQRLSAQGRNGLAIMRTLAEERPAGYIPPQSGLEARVERLARDVGVELRRQVDVGDEAEWIGRVDFEMVGCSDVIEVLSDRYHSSLLDRRADEERFRRIEASGRRLLTLWDRDVWSNAQGIRDQIYQFWLGKVTK